jgi:hypothetical protein
MKHAIITGLAFGVLVATAPAQALPGAGAVEAPSVEQVQYRWERGQVGPGGGWVERGEGPRSWAERGPPPWAMRRGPPPWAPAWGRRYRDGYYVERPRYYDRRDAYAGRGSYGRGYYGGGGPGQWGGRGGGGGYAPGENR